MSSTSNLAPNKVIKFEDLTPRRRSNHQKEMLETFKMNVQKFNQRNQPFYKTQTSGKVADLLNSTFNRTDAFSQRLQANKAHQL